MKSMKQLKKFNGNRNHDLPACSALPLQTIPPRKIDYITQQDSFEQVNLRSECCRDLIINRTDHGDSTQNTTDHDCVWNRTDHGDCMRNTRDHDDCIWNKTHHGHCIRNRIDHDDCVWNRTDHGDHTRNQTDHGNYIPSQTSHIL